MTYHPGKVLKVITKGKEVKGSDEKSQAVVEMWDENLFTFLVEDKISKDVAAEDIVLVDYRPEGKFPVARQIIVKVLKGKIGKDVWDHYKAFHRKKHKMPQTMPMAPPSYMG